MIFNKYYDKTMWALLSTKKRQRILDFINELPSEFLEKIQRSLELYQLNLLKGEYTDNVQLYGELRTDDDMLYYYSLYKDNGVLTIGQAIMDGVEKYRKIEMNIFPMKKEYNKHMGNLDCLYLGNIYYNFVEEYKYGTSYLIDYEKVDFNLMRLPFNNYLVCSTQVLPVFKSNGEIVTDVKNRYSYVDTKNIPCDFDRNILNKKYTLGRRKDY